MITDIPDVTINRIVPEPGEHTLEVELVRGDEFCAENHVNHIDFLKVDAEGYDMQVLLGFAVMLSAGKIDFVQVEAGIASDNTLHIPLRCFEGLLTALGYQILFIKNQASNEVPVLQWADVVFIRSAAAATYA